SFVLQTVVRPTEQSLLLSGLQECRLSRRDHFQLSNGEHWLRRLCGILWSVLGRIRCCEIRPLGWQYIDETSYFGVVADVPAQSHIDFTRTLNILHVSLP